MQQISLSYFHALASLFSFIAVCFSFAYTVADMKIDVQRISQLNQHFERNPTILLVRKTHAFNVITKIKMEENTKVKYNQQILMIS